uniref:Uncharacterized protein n=1 Tax=Panagrolaimus sp. ES5 TaxID=591445 RepID=A0AC34G6M1_9BILA
MEHLIESVKSEVQEHVQPISTGSSMASLLTSESSEIAIIAYSTKNSCFAPSTSENEEDLEIEVSRSATTRSNSEASLLSLAASDSTQTSSAVCDSVASTQASSSDLDTVDLTQTSSTCMITVESTQASVSEESMTQSSSVSTCATSDLECDKTQNSDANDEIAISSPKGSSLKTAMSLHDIISADSMDSSSTIAI